MRRRNPFAVLVRGVGREAYVRLSAERYDRLRSAAEAVLATAGYAHLLDTVWCKPNNGFAQVLNTVDLKTCPRRLGLTYWRYE